MSNTQKIKINIGVIKMNRMKLINARKILENASKLSGTNRKISAEALEKTAEYGYKILEIFGMYIESMPVTKREGFTSILQAEDVEKGYFKMYEALRRCLDESIIEEMN